MKVTVLSTSLLAAASAALAAPSDFKRAALKPISIVDLSGSTYSQTPPTTEILQVTLNDPNTGANGVTCSATWSVGGSSTVKYPCSDKSYYVSVPEGIYNLEDFKLEVGRSDSDRSGSTQVSGKNWSCTKHDGYPEETCSLVGSLEVPLA